MAAASLAPALFEELPQALQGQSLAQQKLAPCLLCTVAATGL
jgi:hypothetical protein